MALGQTPSLGDRLVQPVTNISDSIWAGLWNGEAVIPFPPLAIILLGVGLGVRFLYFFIQDPSRSGHIQSLILASICTVVGAQIFIFGMLGELVRTNRLLLQKLLIQTRRDASQDERED